MMKMLVLSEEALLTSEKTMSEDTGKALSMVQKENIPIILVSRKMYQELRDITEKLQMKKQGVYMIAPHGTSSVYLHTEEVITRECIPYEDQQQLYRLAHENGIHLAYRNENGWVSDYAANPMLQKYAGQDVIDEDFDFLDEDQELEEIWIMQDKETLDMLEMVLKKAGIVRSHRIHEEAIVCTSRHSGEAVALAALMHHLHVAPEDAVMVANSRCDEALLSLCQYKVVMLGADQQLQKRAVMLTSSHDEDGIVTALEKLTDFVEII